MSASVNFVCFQVGGPRLMVRHPEDTQAVTAALAKAIIEITGKGLDSVVKDQSHKLKLAMSMTINRLGR